MPLQILARSDWDDGRWEWEDTPRRDYRDNRPGSSRRQHPTRSPMLAAASPDARLVSPWLGGNTPRSAGKACWDRSFSKTALFLYSNYTILTSQ